MGLFKSKAEKKAKQEKKATKKAEKKAQPKAKKKVLKKFVGKLKGVPFGALLPFKGLMKGELDKKGVAHSDDLGDIAPKFLKHIVQKKNFEDRHSFSSIGQDSDDSLDENFILSAAAIGAIVTGILSFIKSLKDKRDKAKAGEGPALTPDEERILGKAETIADQIEEEVINEAQSETADMIRDYLFSWKGALTGVALILLIVWIIRKA